MARFIEGTQSRNVIGDIKHYALNDQESGRNSVNINISKRAARESDLLAFEIGVEKGKPAAVMCSYNRVNGDFACENKWLLTDVLKKDWKFPGFVLSDWGGTHSDVESVGRRPRQRRAGQILSTRSVQGSPRCGQDSAEPNSTIMYIASCARCLLPA